MEGQIYLGDCLEVAEQIEPNSVDLILCDPPYGVMQNDTRPGSRPITWDYMIPPEKLLDISARVLRRNGTAIFFSQGIFTAQMRLAKNRWLTFTQGAVWIKNNTGNHFGCKKNLTSWVEDISVYRKTGGTSKNEHPRTFNVLPGRKQNKNIFEYAKDVPSLHPTQKPVGLLEELIRIYTNEGDTVLDWTMGVGSTCVAAVNTRRNYIGVEMNEEYFAIAKERIEEAKYSLLC